MNLLYLDLLGTRKKWERGGRAAVEASFARFEQLVKRGLSLMGPEGLLDGGIEADSAAIVCADELKSLRLSQAILAEAFSRGADADDSRLWIRGAIVPILERRSLRSVLPMDAPFNGLSLHRYSSPLLDAIATERSGFKGMRILVADTLITEPLRAAVRIPVGTRYLIPLRRLDHSDYRVGGFQDWLWMLVTDEETWSRTLRQMAARLRWAAGDSDEFVQAAATQVVFHECEAIRSSLRSRASG